MLSESLSSRNNEKVFLDWWAKFSLYFNRFSKKQFSNKRKKLRKLKENIDLSVFESLVSSFGFKSNVDFFEESLPDDTENLVNLLALGEESVADEEDTENVVDAPIDFIIRSNSAETEDGRFVGKFVSENVINLSSRNLSEAEISLLSKGLKFVPTPSSINFAEIKEDLEKFGRNLRLKWLFRNDERDFSYNPFRPKSKFNPRRSDASIEIYLSRLEEELMSISSNVKYNNLTALERNALHSLKQDKTIIIKEADKGFYADVRKTLFDNIINTIGSISSLSNDKLIHLLLYGKEAYSVEVNAAILKYTIVFLKSSERFDMALI